MENEMSEKPRKTLDERIEIAKRRARLVAQPFIELFYGIKTRQLPWEYCTAVFVVVSLLITFRADVWLWRRMHLAVFYPERSFFYWSYYLLCTSSGFLLWAGLETMRRRLLAQELAETFICAGLKNRLGKFPAFISDKPLDGYTRKIKVTNARLPLDTFRQAKAAIESGLDVYVDEIKETRGEGTIEIVYSSLAMPELCRVENLKKIGHARFVIGKTRSKFITATFDKISHLLVAGQTNSGKSTFLRQLIVTIYLNNPTFTFTLIDLKEGLEFQTFEQLPRMNVFSQLKAAARRLKKYQALLEKRLKLLKLNKCKDLAAYLKMPEANRVASDIEGQSISLNPHLIVIDEAADLFLAGSETSGSDLQDARRALIEIARKGRAAGMHLIFSTQRPDSKSIDPQIKANLPGIVCFQMPNDASSITVLGNGRATDLAPVAGRAIWKTGSEFIEVQTPYITESEAEQMLRSFKDEKLPAKADDEELNESPQAKSAEPKSDSSSQQSSDKASKYGNI